MEDLKLLNKEFLDLSNELFRGKNKLNFNINQIYELCKNQLYENDKKQDFDL